MTTEEKVKELLSKEYAMDTWDCYNDEPNTEEWMLEQRIKNSLIVVDEVLNLMINNFKWDAKHNGNIHFWQEVKEQLENKL